MKPSRPDPSIPAMSEGLESSKSVLDSSEPDLCKLPTSQTVAYGVGGLANQVFDSGVGNLAFYVFNIGLGVNPFLVGLAQSIARGVDLFTDPLAGYLCDALRSRFSLRRYIALGSVIGGVSFASIWLFPLGLSHSAYFMWLIVCFAIASVAWSFFSVPRYALGFEMTINPNDRTRLMTFQAFMATSCNLCMCWSYRITQLPIFGGALNGARWVGSTMGAIIIATGLVSAIVCKTRRHYIDNTTVSRSPSVRDFWMSGKRVLSNRTFITFMGTIALSLGGIISTYGVSPYLLIYYVQRGSQSKGALLIGITSTAWLITSMALAAPVAWCAGRFGKRQALLIFLGVAFAGACTRWFFYNPSLPWLSVVPYACFGCGVGAIGALGPSLTADISDTAESNTGLQGGGMFSAFYSWTIKVSMTLGFVIAGLLLNLSGFSAIGSVIPDSHTILWMRILDSVCPAISLAGALWLLWRTPSPTRA